MLKKSLIRGKANYELFFKVENPLRGFKKNVNLQFCISCIIQLKCALAISKILNSCQLKKTIAYCEEEQCSQKIIAK